MVKGKATRTRKRRTKKNGYFPEVKGKIVERVEVTPADHGFTIGILFQDRTYLSFDIEPSLTVMPELSDWKTGNWRGIKRWPALHSSLAMVSWP